MYKRIVPTYTGRMKSVECFEGEQIEEKVNRIVNNNKPITDGAPIIFTEKKDGVLPEYNPRTDRGTYRDWETDRKSTRLNSSHITRSRMPSSA